MEVKDLDSWEQLSEAIQILESDLRQREEEGFPAGVSKPLFRGQGNASWSLQTTLERATSQRIPLTTYFHFARMARPRVVAFTNQTWEMPSKEKCQNWQDEVVNVKGCVIYKLPGHDYLAYLRHHGFPSPLLDWTASPYVAAFFAFRQPPREAEYVSIYAYVEYAGYVKRFAGATPEITEFGPSTGTTKRHFLQQSRYTICTLYRDGQLYFQPHEEVAGQSQGQDLLWKFNLPVSERKKALTSLQRMNVNAYSLFNSEDSLLETIANEDLFLNGLL